MRTFLLACVVSLALLPTLHGAEEKTNPGTNINSSGCRCLIDAPLKVCADHPFEMTVNLLSDTLIDKAFTIELKGTADARFDTPDGPKVKQQRPCPSVGVYTVWPGTEGGKKIEVWVGSALCKEIEVNRVRITRLPKNDRLLCGGKEELWATVTPAGEPLTWSYVVDLAFNPNNDPKAVKTKIKAPYTPSQADATDKVRVVAVGCVDERALTLTHPRYVRAGRTENQSKTVKVPAGKRESPILLNYQAQYIILDQFKRVITDSAFGGAKLLHQETTPLQSAYPAITQWIATVEVGGARWFPNSGSFRDNLVINKVPLSDFRTREGFWDTSVKGKTILSMTTHDWRVSVDEQLPQTVATNTFTVVVQDVTKDELTLASTYTFQLAE